MSKLFCDLKSDEEKYNFFLFGHGYETGVISITIQNDVALAYKRCCEFSKALVAERKRREEAEAMYASTKAGIDHIEGRAERAEKLYLEMKDDLADVQADNARLRVEMARILSSGNLFEHYEIARAALNHEPGKGDIADPCVGCAYDKDSQILRANCVGCAGFAERPHKVADGPDVPNNWWEAKPEKEDK